MTRFCVNRPKSRTCAKPPVPAAGNGIAAAEIMLFGVRVAVDSMRKSVSLNNLSQYVQPQDGGGANGGGGDAPSDAAAASGYASADDGVPNSSAASTARERKRGIPWTEDEHKMFLLGLHKVGKGDWRGISRNFVKTRTPTQVASHAQKYFLRRSNLNRRRRRSSLFDITTDAICPMDGYGEQIQTRSIFSLPGSCIAGSFQAGFPAQTEDLAKSLTLGKGDHQATKDATSSQKLVHPILILPGERRSMAVDFDLNQESTAEPAPPSLKLFLLSNLNRTEASSFSSGDCSSGSIISVS